MSGAFKKRTPKIPTPIYLENVALAYLSRYAASEFSLRQVLQNRLRRAIRFSPEFAADDVLQNKLRATIDVIVDKHKKSGTLNDAAFAEMKVMGLRRAGRSARAIKQKLAHKGIKSELIDSTLIATAQNGEQGETQAALILARRRKLGPYRRGERDFEIYKKELAIMARAGFSISVAQHVLALSADDLADPMQVLK